MAKETAPLYTFDWLAQEQPDLYTQVQASAEQPLDISIRINQLKADPQTAIEKWAGLYDWQIENVPYCPSGFWIRQAGKAPSSTIEHRLGYYYIQEAASMLPAELFDFKGIEHPLILDMAASPGGKTIHLADRSADRGFIVANDASRGRINALRIVLNNWGVINQAITCLPGELIGTLYPDTFDAVLLDAPCSMQGLRTSESHKNRTITLNEVDALASRQERLLESALQAVKPGGQVVYSTCTLTPQEDEGVLAALLDKYPGCFEIQDVHQRLPRPARGLDAFNREAFPASVQNAVRIWPHSFGTAGFFAAKLVKTGEIPQDTSNTRMPTRKPPKIVIPLPSECEGITRFLSDLHGFDLTQLMQEQDLQIVELNGTLSLVAKTLLSTFSDLPWLSSGMPLGKALPKEWQPSHEFVSRFGDQFTQGIWTLEDEYIAGWQRGEDIRGYNADPSLRGKVVAVRDTQGRNLGRGKVLEKRLKNILPTRLF